MPEKKLTAAQQRAADAAAAEAERASKEIERKRLMGAGAVLAAVALFVGGYAIGNSSNDSNLVGSDVIAGRTDQPGPRGRTDGVPGPRGGFDFSEQYPDGFPMGPRGGFQFPEDFPFGDSQGGFGFNLECNADGTCTFQVPDGFEFPGRGGPFTEEAPDSEAPNDEAPTEEAPANQPGFLGVGVGQGPQGVVVQALAPGAPAEMAGIEVGDVLVSVDGVAIGTIDDLVDVVSEAGAGASVEVTVARSGREIMFNVVLNAPPA